jgi:hypothetical protein
VLGSYIVTYVDSHKWSTVVGMDNHGKSVPQDDFIELNHC